MHAKFSTLQTYLLAKHYGHGTQMLTVLDDVTVSFEQGESYAITGASGSGKSTFAVKLHKATGIPPYHLDKYFYSENWVERNYQEFLTIQQEFVDQEQWIIDGNSIKSLDIRWARATIVLYFNYPLLLCYWRVFKRLFSKDPHIDDRAQQCSETIQWSLLKYMWTFNQRVTGVIEKLRKQCPQAAFYEIKNDQALDKLSQKLFGKLL